ncbi:hypothetical protein [Spirosoma panaciterrae]|uniref:hypothetical protein n=1 Tax=Spirosoma panaciterrae TaxID=496058 RepID=UPI0003A04F9F|nr:hypothetical protein [Spirosoma panaciterrae]
MNNSFTPRIWRISAIVKVFFVLNCAFLQAQPLTREQLIGTWIGIRIDFDEQVSRAYPVSMKLGADSTFLLRLIDVNPPSRVSTWSITNGKVRLDTNVYALKQWSFQKQNLYLVGAYPTIFRRLTDIAIDSASVRETIIGYEWKTDSLLYHFHQDGSSCIENTKTGGRSIQCWRLAQISQSPFLVIKGNTESCDGNFQYPLQVVRLLADTLECLGDKSGADRLIFRRGTKLANDYSCQSTGFQTCNRFVSPLFKLYPYFSYRRGRLYDIRQVVDRNYKSIYQPGQSGLIRFRFVVNCKGEAGQFNVLEVDENYQKRSFDTRITDQLLMICQNKLTDWEPGKQNEDQMPTDTYCLLTFRIKDGIIT